MTMLTRSLFLGALSVWALLGQQNLTVTGSQCSTSQQAVNSITTSGTCAVSGNVKFEAGGVIHLTQGFRATASAGATFDAVVVRQPVAAALTSPAACASGPALSPT